MNPIKSIPAAMAHHLPAGSVIVDVRNHPELVECRLTAPFIHVPLDQVSRDVLQTDHGVALNTPLYMLCRAGVRARTAAMQLAMDGFTDLTVIEGGIIACVDSDHQTVSGE
ncbi:MAG: rhodanese-like domain-containing protein [Pseudomonadota bacterium]